MARLWREAAALLPFLSSLPLRIIPALLCLFGAFGLSLFFTGYADIIYAPSVLLLLAAVLLTVLPALKVAPTFPHKAPAFILLGLWGYITLSLIWSTVPFTSLVTYLVFLALPLGFFTFLIPVNRQQILTGVMGGLIAGLALLGGWALIQYWVLSDIYGPRAHHPFINPNNLATLLNLGLMPLMAYLLHAPSDKNLSLTRYAGAAIMALLTGGGLLATQSRSGFLFALIGILFLCIILRHDIRAHLKFSLGLATGALILFALFQLPAGQQLASRLGDLAAQTPEPAVTTRLSLWRQGFSMFKEYGLTGTGLGSFYLYYPAFRLPFADNSAGNWAHMDPLQLGIETGFITPVLFYSFAIAVFWRTVRVLGRSAPTSRHRAAIAGITAALLSLFLHAHTSFPLYLLPALLIGGIWLAAWYNTTAAVLPGPSYVTLHFTRKERSITYLAALLIAGMIGMMAVTSAAGQFYLKSAHNALNKGQIEGFLDNITKAQQWAPASFIDPQVQITGFYIDMLGASDILLNRTEQEKLFREGLALLEQAEALNPAWAEIDYKRGRLYQAINPALEPRSKEQAKASWLNALEKDPTHSRARMAMTRAYMGEGNAVAAYELMQEGDGYPVAKDLYPDYHKLYEQVAALAMLQRPYQDKPEIKNLPPREERPRP